MSCDRVQLQWTPPTYPINFSPIKYNVISSPAGSCSDQSCTTTTTSYNVTDLELNTHSYTFTIHSSVCDCEEYSNGSFVSLEKLGKLPSTSVVPTTCVSFTCIVPLEPVKDLRIENCDYNNNRRLYWSPPINNTVNIKGYNITITPPPSQTSSGCQCTTGHCNISSDVTSFDINCLDYDINYTITVIPISVCETLTGERQSVSCLPKNVC